VASRASGKDVSKVVRDRFLQLLVRAGVWLPIRSPAEELSRVPESVPFHVLISDLDDELGPERDEGEVLLGVPPAEF
jgi:hypothetical protein